MADGIVKFILTPLFALSLTGCALLDTRGAVVACQAADTATTLHAISLGAREANPVVRWLLEHTGAQGFIAAKLAVTLLVLDAYSELSSDVVIAVNAITCGVAVHNARVATTLQKQAQP